MTGRKPTGPRLVHNLDGSDQAKDRLETMLETLFGLPVEEACQRLGIGEAMLHRLRTRALQGALKSLEPRPRGRPPHLQSPEEQEIENLRAQVSELQDDLKIAELKREIETILPRVQQTSTSTDAARKKTKRRQQHRKWERELRRQHKRRNRSR